MSFHLATEAGKSVGIHDSSNARWGQKDLSQTLSKISIWLNHRNALQILTLDGLILVSMLFWSIKCHLVILCCVRWTSRMSGWLWARWQWPQHKSLCRSSRHWRSVMQCDAVVGTVGMMQDVGISFFIKCQDLRNTVKKIVLKLWRTSWWWITNIS